MGHLGTIELGVQRRGVGGVVLRMGFLGPPGTEPCPRFLPRGSGRFYTLLFPNPDAYLPAPGCDISTSRRMTGLRPCDARTAMSPGLGGHSPSRVSLLRGSAPASPEVSSCRQRASPSPTASHSKGAIPSFPLALIPPAALWRWNCHIMWYTF